MGAGVVVGLALAGCSSGTASDAQGSPGASEAGKIAVVTSTNVYSDIASQVGGDKVSATPVIDSSAQDPHSYEATPQDRLNVSEADLVVRNGGGFDPFIDDMTEDGTRVIDAVAVSGLQPEGHEEHHGDDPGGEDHDHGGFNEHVWYDLDTMQKLTTRIAEQLGELDREHADGFTDRARSLTGDLTRLKQRVSDVAADGGYVATEPVPGYLLQDAGLHDATPAAFTEAVDAESDVPPAVMKQTTDLISGGEVELVAFNEQTSTGQTEQLRTAAQQAGVPVVEFTETLPDGQDYQQWMRENIDHVAQALKK